MHVKNLYHTPALSTLPISLLNLNLKWLPEYLISTGHSLHAKTIYQALKMFGLWGRVDRQESTSVYIQVCLHRPRSSGKMCYGLTKPG